MTKQYLHFSVNLEDMNDLARQAWSEGRYHWTMELLKNLGLSAHDAYEVIRGKLRMSNAKDDQVD